MQIYSVLELINYTLTQCSIVICESVFLLSANSNFRTITLNLSELSQLNNSLSEQVVFFFKQLKSCFFCFPECLLSLSIVVQVYCVALSSGFLAALLAIALCYDFIIVYLVSVCINTQYSITEILSAPFTIFSHLLSLLLALLSLCL